MYGSIALEVTAASLSSSATLVSALVALVGFFVVVAGGLGTWAALRVGKNSAVIANYKATAESWENRATALTAEKDGLEEELTTARSQIADLTSKNETLQQLVTGQPVVAAISEEMKEGFDKLARQMGRVGDRLGKIEGFINDRPTTGK
jgi:hypothetical protein